MQGFGVGEETHEVAPLHVVLTMDTPTAATGDDVFGLLEFMVVGAEEDGFPEGHCFENVVYAYAESAADISHVGIEVEFGQNAYVVDDKDFRVFRVF